MGKIKKNYTLSIMMPVDGKGIAFPVKLTLKDINKEDLVSYLNANSFNMFLTLWQLSEVPRLDFSVCSKVHVNSGLEENIIKNVNRIKDDSNEKP